VNAESALIDLRGKESKIKNVCVNIMNENRTGHEQKRQRWNSKIGIILAVAGSAIGLGNFLRFPVQAASNGGGAFMIPYLISLFLLGIPLMWIEWTLGRYGGGFGHSTAPGIFHSLREKNRLIKYFGVIGIFGPIVIYIYYVYIESWLLGYTFLSMTSGYSQAIASDNMAGFLSGYQGVVKNQYFQSILPAYLFFLATFFINLSVVWRGISGGIEKLCKYAMPALFGCAIILMIRVLTLGTPDPARPELNVINGLGYLWNPDLSALTNARVWLAAAGQIFFSLSVGIGVILTYASYLTKKDDVVLSGLSSASTNEFAEVILGGTIVIPATFVFFGAAGTLAQAQGGAFNLGFITMPKIFGLMPGGRAFAPIWFLLLFLAGVTSSISLAQPAIAFMEDEFNISRKRAVVIFGVLTFVLAHLSIFLLARGVVDELDFWGGTFSLVLFATIETILFVWVFGADRAWDEMHIAADISIPKFYKFIIKYVTPVFLMGLLGTWFVQDGLPVVLMRNVPPANRGYVLATRIVLLILFAAIAIAVAISWARRQRKTSGLSERNSVNRMKIT